MSPSEFVDRWHALADDPDAQRSFLASASALLTDEMFERMKDRASAERFVNAQRAYHLAQSILQAAAGSPAPLHRAWGLMALGNVCHTLGQNEEALVAFHEAHTLCLQAGAEVAATRPIIGMLGPLIHLARYDEALRVAEATRPILERHGAWELAAALDGNAAIVCRNLGDYGRALALYDQAKAAFLQVGVLARTGDRLFAVELNRAIMLRQLDRFEEAIESANAALALAQELALPIPIARAHRCLGQLYFLMGNYTRALATFYEASECFRAEGLRVDLLVTESFQAECLLALNEWSQALDLVQTIAPEAEGLNLGNTTAFAHLFGGRALRGLQRLPAALDELETARNFFERVGNRHWLAHVELERALLALQTGERALAHEAAARAYAGYGSLHLLVEQAQAALVLARVAEWEGEPDTAQALYAQAEGCGQTHNLALLVAEAQAGQARLAARAGRPAEALALLEGSLRGFEQTRGRLAHDLRISFLADKLDHYALGIELTLESGDAAAAFLLAERARSRALVELFDTQPSWRLRLRDPRDRALLEEFADIQQEQRWFLQRARQRSAAGESEEATPAQREQWLASARACESKLERLLLRLQVRDARYGEDRALHQVEATLPTPYLSPGTLLLEYVSLGETLWLFCATGSGITATRLPTSRSEINRLLASLRLNFSRVPVAPHERPALDTQARALLHRLFRALLAPIESALREAERLFIVPHDRLHYLPFHALWDGEQALADRLPVAYLPAASLLASLDLRRRRQRSPRAGRPLILAHSDGGRLPLTHTEAERVSRSLGGHLVLEEAATREALRGAGSSPIIHLAAHGEFRPEAPLFSAIHLADGPLTAVDFLAFQWHAELVTLSACESGLGSIRPGDEVIGISRACFYAGAGSLLLSLWRVADESTALLMDHFYRTLLGGTTKSEALREAQSALRAIPEYAHPFFWAPFFLMGDGHTPLAIPATRTTRFESQ